MGKFLFCSLPPRCVCIYKGTRFLLCPCSALCVVVTVQKKLFKIHYKLILKTYNELVTIVEM